MCCVIASEDEIRQTWQNASCEHGPAVSGDGVPAEVIPGMSSVSATAQVTGRERSRQLQRIQQASMGAATMLVAQYALGAAYNLYGTAPTAHKSIGMFSSPLLAVHAILGLLLIVAATGLLARAVIARHGITIVTSAIGLLAIIGAAGAGSAFTRDGAAGASLGMAM